MKKILLLPLALLTFGSCATTSQEGTKGDVKKVYTADWNSFDDYETPQWFSDAKFGIFIHWGPYCVPAYRNEWYPCNMYDSTFYRTVNGEVYHPFNHHKATYGDQKTFGYKDFIPMFKAEKFDAVEWADIFERSGAKYVVPVGEHHDGFAMYASTITRWNSVDMGPKRDIVGELAKAVRATGSKLGVSSHFSENWYYYKHSDEFDTGDPQYADLYGRPHEEGAPADAKFLKEFEDRTKEIIDLYEPDLLWFDGAFNAHEGMYSKLDIMAYYYNRAQEWDKGVVLNYKNNDRHTWRDGAAVLDIERGKLDGIRSMPWQTDTSLGRYNWGYSSNMIVKTANEIIDELIDIVSKNGNMLLNIAPKSDGTIPDDQVKVLLEIGEWLKVNGEGIYATRPWKLSEEGPTVQDLGGNSHMNELKAKDTKFTGQDFRFTTNGRDIYAISLGMPEKEVAIKTLHKDSEYYDYKIKSVSILGYGKVNYKLTDKALIIDVPADAKLTEEAVIFKIEAGDLMYLDLRNK